MMAAGVHCVRTSTVERPSGDVGQGVENSRGCRRSPLKAEFFSLREPGVDRKYSLGYIPVVLVREEIMAVVQEEEKLVP